MHRRRGCGVVRKRNERRGLVDPQDPDDDVVGACVFADGSFIDEWGIAYHAFGDVRGKDLAEVFRFDQDDLPDIAFGE